MHFEVKVMTGQEGKRIDSYLALELDVSRSKVQKLIREEKVTVNGKVISNNYVTKEGDVIIVNDELNYEVTVVPEDIPLDVFYEDDDLLVINKPSGMVVHPAPGHYTKTLVNALLYRFQLSHEKSLRPGIVHRLDKDTSGLMLVAKNDKTHDILAKMIADREVKRHYLAIVDGVIKHDTGTIDAPIGRDPNNRQKMAVTDVHGKNAITHFRVLEAFSNYSLVECILETGRTHQIRVHMAYIGHPVANDPMYGHGKATEFGQMLHSKSIQFLHPTTGKKMYFEAEPPKEFLDFLEILRKNEK